MSLNNLQPAAGIVAKFGGCRPMSRVLGVNASTISRWTTCSTKGGTGGRIPQKYWSFIFQIARQQGHKLRLSDFTGSLD